MDGTVQAEDFQEHNLGGVILVYYCYSEQSVLNLTKRRTLPPLFSAEIFNNVWHSPSGRFPRKHSWWNYFSLIATLNSQSAIWPKEGIYHQEIFKNGCLLTFSYATRSADCISSIKIKHNFFKNTFFSSAIIEWSKLDLSIQNSESLGIFKSNILKFFRPTPRSFFNCYNHKGIRLMAGLRLGLSRLREHKFNQNFQNCINPLCSCDIESTSHFFLHCPLSDDKTITLLSTLNKIDCKLIVANESSLIETLLSGNSLFDLKKNSLFLMHPLITFYLLQDSKKPYFNKF